MSVFGQTPSPDSTLLHAWMLWEQDADLDLVALYELHDGNEGAVFSQGKGGCAGELGRAPFVLVPEDEPEVPSGWSCREDLFATRLERFRQLWILGLHTGRLTPGTETPTRVEARGAVARAFGEQPVVLHFDDNTVACVLHVEGAPGTPGQGLDLASLKALPGGTSMVNTLRRYHPPPVVARLRWESSADLDLLCLVTPPGGGPPTRLEPGYQGALGVKPWALLSRDEGGPGKPVEGSKAEHLLLPRPEHVGEVLLLARIHDGFEPFFGYHGARVFLSLGSHHTVIPLDQIELGSWCTVARIRCGLRPRVEPIAKVSRVAPELWQG